jgi:hypothetical protein
VGRKKRIKRSAPSRREALKGDISSCLPLGLLRVHKLTSFRDQIVGERFLRKIRFLPNTTNTLMAPSLSNLACRKEIAGDNEDARDKSDQSEFKTRPETGAGQRSHVPICFRFQSEPKRPCCTQGRKAGAQRASQTLKPRLAIT